MYSFQAKIGLIKRRKGEKKSSFRSVPTRRVIENSKIKAEKLEN